VILSFSKFERKEMSTQSLRFPLLLLAILLVLSLTNSVSSAATTQHVYDSKNRIKEVWVDGQLYYWRENWRQDIDGDGIPNL
jgi:hypothetical protein